VKLASDFGASARAEGVGNALICGDPDLSIESID